MCLSFEFKFDFIIRVVPTFCCSIITRLLLLSGYLHSSIIIAIIMRRIIIIMCFVVIHYLIPIILDTMCVFNCVLLPTNICH